MLSGTERGGLKLINSCYSDIEEKLRGIDCVLAFETASDYLGMNAGTHQRLAYYVYSLEELNLEGVDCTILDSYDSLDILEERGMRCTSRTQTIIDLLSHDRDDQVILESLADWYFSHNESFNDLVIPDNIKDLFNEYKYDAIHYYDNW